MGVYNTCDWVMIRFLSVSTTMCNGITPFSSKTTNPVEQYQRDN